MIFSYVIFTYKLFLITSGTSYLFFGIHLSTTIPVVSFVCLFLGIYVSVIFVVLFDKAFHLPEKTNDLKLALILATQRLSHRETRICIKLKVKSVPKIGIKVGDFATLERISTPSFIDFITQQVVGLLITFR